MLRTLQRLADVQSAVHDDFMADNQRQQINNEKNFALLKQFAATA